MRLGTPEFHLTAQSPDRDGDDSRAQHAEEGQPCGPGDTRYLDHGQASPKPNPEGIPAETAEKRAAQPLHPRPCGSRQQRHQQVDERAEPWICHGPEETLAQPSQHQTVKERPESGIESHDQT